MQTYESKIYIKNYSAEETESGENIPFSEIYLVVDTLNSDFTLNFERKDFRDETTNFNNSLEFNEQFLRSNMIPKDIKKISVSYSNNFCLHFFGFFTPMQKSKFDYYPKSGVYHIQNYGYRFTQLDELLAVIKHKNLAGYSTFENNFFKQSDEDIYFLLFLSLIHI